MFTSFDQSFLRVLQEFNERKILGSEDLYNSLRDEVLQLSLGGATLDEFLEALATDGYLSRCGNRYRLSAKGRRRKRELNSYSTASAVCRKSC